MDPETRSMTQKYGIGTRLQNSFQSINRSAVPLCPRIFVCCLPVIIKVHNNRHTQLPCRPEQPYAVGRIIHGTDLYFPADLCSVDLICRNQHTACLFLPGIGRVPQNKSFRSAFLVGETPGKGGGTVTHSQNRSAHLFKIDLMMFVPGADMGKKPCLTDAVLIHILKGTGKIMSQPVRVVVCVNDLHYYMILSRFSVISSVSPAFMVISLLFRLARTNFPPVRE